MAMKHKSVSTAHRVKELIETFDTDRIFSTQELLREINFGSRNSIDLALTRLVKERIITRLARGVYAKTGVNPDKITPVSIATTKAKAFGKTIYSSGVDASLKVGITSDEPVVCNTGMDQSKHINVYTFYTSGSSSSFKFDNNTILFKSASHRKRELPDDVSGIVLKAVWHQGSSNIARTKVKARFIALNQKKDELQDFRSYIRNLPKWIVKNLYPAIA